jgi:NAD(P)-dependent dehydrogenase (short-subunit alcohol dehydrogenase family)
VTPAADRLSLADRVALVTGASRGIGRAIAVTLAAAGADCALVARSRETLQAIADEISALGRRAEPLAGDVADATAVERIVRETLARFGRIDVLVNAAGVSPIFKRAEEIEPTEWDAILATNLRGTFLCCRAVGRTMLERGSGSIVNLSSIGAQVGLARLAAYNASKAGVEALTRTLAIEWAPRRVRVNAIGPAFVRTEMTEGLYRHEGLHRAIVERTPLARFAVPEDLVGAALFLASDAAGFVTGTTLPVDGGWLAQ